MTPEQRQAALRLADAIDDDDYYHRQAAALLRELAADPLPGEPVATLHRHPSIGILRVTFEDAVTELVDGTYPLYAAPQQRQPLTHMQAVLLWGHRSDGPTTEEIVSFARLIESAHGIGEAA